ncbi:MAG TPA: exo-alpha-sialidase [Propionibacteriaceae bacterium]|nr:exo-alpha-sialidase [Propionibacteriaceae bacterium]
MTSRYAAQAGHTPVVDRSLFDGALRAAAEGTGRSDAYLPAATVQSHAAMLERLGNGDLGLAWFGGTQEGVGDISIWFSRLPAAGKQWSDPVQLTDDTTRSEQNPVLFTAPNGQLWLLYTAQLAGNQDTAEVRRRISLDDGHSWGPVESLFPATDRGGVFIRQPLLVTDSGRWLLPIFTCVAVPGEKWSGDVDTSSVMISDDHGASWREVPVPDSTGCVHMSIVQLPDASLYALFRSRWADHIYQSRSTDDGDTWTPPAPTELPNNNSSLQQRLLADGRIAVIYNHASRLDATARRESLYDEIDDEGLVESDPTTSPQTTTPPPTDGEPGTHKAFWGAPRAPMSLAFSTDQGQSWQVAGNLDEGDGFCLTNNSRDALNREFSYPVIHQRPDGDLDLAYTYFRQTIKHVRVPASWEQPTP